MARWEPNAQGRLAQAALELFAQRGYEQTTVAEIAERAGLTARTFFRYFADKREVLFAGSSELQDRLVAALESAPADATAMEAVAAALDEAAELLGGHRDYSRQRQAVIAAHQELRERELFKMSTLAVALADALRRRVVPEPNASLAAEAGVAVFRVAFERWVSEPGEQTLGELMRSSLAQLRTLTA